MVSVRLMTREDCDRVVELNSLAFSVYYPNGRPRTRENILAALEANPAGCFVATLDGESVGFIFSRIWGSVACIGTFGVHPDRQGHGIGRALLQAVVDMLQRAGCATLGLETMPNSPYNVQLYTRFGFFPSYPTCYLSKTSDNRLPSPGFALHSQLENSVALTAITHVSAAAWPGADYASEAASARRCKWGDTLLIGWPDTYAIAVVRTISRLQGVDPIAEVSNMAIMPEARERLGHVLSAVESFVASRNLSEVILPVNAIDAETLQWVLAKEWRVQKIMLRMVYKKTFVPAAGIDLSRWLM
jgi:GNAT superfamily N-acetyltransferase